MKINESVRKTQKIIDQDKNHNQLPLKNNLKENLSLFGLCPFDWTIKNDSNHNQFLIENKDDKDFKFLGYTDLNGTMWKSISLVSI